MGGRLFPFGKPLHEFVNIALAHHATGWQVGVQSDFVGAAVKRLFMVGRVSASEHGSSCVVDLDSFEVGVFCIEEVGSMLLRPILSCF
jgi:hypothetical protein